MARTKKADARSQPNSNCNNRRVAAAKEIASAREGRTNSEYRFKIKFLLPQGKNVEVKQCGNVVR